MNIRTLGLLATALCTIGFAGAMAKRATSTPAGTQTPAATPAGTVPMEQGTVTVLGYGAIGTAEGALSPAEFVRQMDSLKKAGITPIPLQDFLDWRAGRKQVPDKAVLLTFDNADRGFVTTALPELQKRGYPFLLFVDTHCLARLQDYITEKELCKVPAMGGSVGVCYATPESVRKWQEAELKGKETVGSLTESELGGPAERLSRLCGGVCQAFSHYSNGADLTIMRELVRTGYTVAFSRVGGVARKDSPGFFIPRYMVATAADFPFIPAGTSTATTQNTPATTPAAPATPATPPGPATPALPIDIEDDCVAIDDDEEEEAPPTPAKPEQPAQPAQAATTEGQGEDAGEAEPPLEHISTDPVTPTYARLGKRTPDGHWVTTTFDKPLVPREQTRVAVLGYHNFSNTKTISEMRMRTHVFCQQMQYIREAGITVISMQDFIEWRFGDRLLPERCVLITIDDGWKSVYTDAYPVLKAYGYPFTLFLYTRYIDVQGDSMTTAQIREMQGNGATIGSHSTNHLYPRSWKRYNKKPEEYAAQIQTEILDSGTTLTSKFGPCTAYCYPGGYNTPQMIGALKTSPYRVAFTVLERKVECTEPAYQIHRYMVFGNDHRIFRRAVNFDGEAGIKPTEQGIAAAEATARNFFPPAFEGVPLPEGQTARTPADADGDTPADATGADGTDTPTSTPTTPSTSKPKKSKNNKRKKK